MRDPDGNSSVHVIVRNRAIALGFALRSTGLRAWRRLRALGQPRLRGLDHVTIPVHDLDVARRFYCDVLGAAHLMTIDEAALKRLSRPPAANGGDGVYHVSVLLGAATRLDLFLQAQGQPALMQAHPHYAFRVAPGEMLRWKERLEANGVPTEGPLQLGPPGQASLYFNDPSGNHLEVTCFGFARPIPIRAPTMTALAWGPAQDTGARRSDEPAP
jgi:catechol 2,3-dioxygenase-like lactoylglutathione lyase family enzyme